MRSLLLLLAFLFAEPWLVVTAHHASNLRGLAAQPNCHASAPCVLWASGSKGMLLHSPDGGSTWHESTIPGAEKLDFRGIALVNDHTLFVISSGEGDASRIYKSADSGASWQLQYTSANKEFFLDAIACATENTCFALSDPVGGKFLVLKTEDGAHWKELPPAGMPAALPKEGAFAASNSSLLVASTSELYFATGGAARVFHSLDAGLHWTAAETPVLSGAAPQGIFSLAKRGSLLVAVGGDYEKPALSERNAVYSTDGGRSWRLADQNPGGYRSGVAATETGFIAVGPTGNDISKDGQHWEPLGTLPLNAVIFQNSAWAAGPDGTVARLNANSSQLTTKP